MARATREQRPTRRPDGAAAEASPRLRTFFVTTFVVSWGAGALMMAFSAQVEELFGPMGYTNPVFILVVWTPGLVGLALVARHHGGPGLGRFLGRLSRWRMSAGWWVVLLVGMPAVFYGGAVLNGNIGDPFPFDPWYQVFPALLPAFLIGPVEELGWRGVALPLLQRRLAPLWAALVLGVVVAVWHTPAFLLSGTKQSAWSYWPFFLGVVAISVILTAMFNAARGSLLVAFLFHAQMNGPAWPDAQPWDMYLFAVVAVIVVLLNKTAMLDRTSAVTEIVPDDARAPREAARPESTPEMQEHR